jgi:hypothetical protein
MGVDVWGWLCWSRRICLEEDLSMKRRTEQVLLASAFVACISTNGAFAQQYPPGTHVQVSPTSNDWVGATIVKYDAVNHSYIVHFDVPYHYTPECRVALDNVRPGGAAPPRQAPGNPAPGGVEMPNDAGPNLPIGSHVQVSPSGTGWVGGTIAQAVNGGYIIKFDSPYFGQPELRVPSDRIAAPGAAPPVLPGNVPPGNPNINPFNPNGAPQKAGPGLPPAQGLAGSFQESIRQQNNAATEDATKTVTFQSWSMTGPGPQTLKLGASLLDPGKTIPNAYLITTKFVVDTYYSGSGAHNLVTIQGTYLGYMENGQVVTSAMPGGSISPSVYVPGK